ncbi:hypothetical protein ACI3QN_12585, partial [Propionibacterium freudenreichii]|uniref:hypothetical protein n=1 Tax=Propionibacterium freudenreichii TaxID=1744 RepID=UPI0038543DE3
STGFNQLVYCSSLGQSQFNNTSVTYSCTVGTINATSTGVGIGLYSLANWSAARVSYNATFSLSTTNRGKIIWDATYGGVNYPSLQISTSA